MGDVVWGEEVGKTEVTVVFIKGSMRTLAAVESAMTEFTRTTHCTETHTQTELSTCEQDQWAISVSMLGCGTLL